MTIPALTIFPTDWDPNRYFETSTQGWAAAEVPAMSATVYEGTGDIGDARTSSMAVEAAEQAQGTPPPPLRPGSLGMVDGMRFYTSPYLREAADRVTFPVWERNSAILSEDTYVDDTVFDLSRYPSHTHSIASSRNIRVSVSPAGQVNTTNPVATTTLTKDALDEELEEVKEGLGLRVEVLEDDVRELQALRDEVADIRDQLYALRDVVLRLTQHPNA